jgi:DNA (cytosine-5)-methyltransferase 1
VHREEYSVQLLRKDREGVVQGGLFSSSESVERILFDDTTRELKRQVYRRDPKLPPETSYVGTYSDTGWPADLRAAADQVFLRTRVRPPQLSGAAIRVVDLFSGIGAMSLGVAEACRAMNLAFESAGGFDINDRAATVYAANFGQRKPRPTDLTTILQSDLSLPASDEEKSFVEDVGLIDIAVAGPPCQGHSNLNNLTRRKDPKNELYFLLARFAQLAKPRAILVENVMSVRNDVRRVVNRTGEALEELGYTVSDGIVDLWTIGVPQTRRRHILVARLFETEAERAQVPTVMDMIAPYRTRPRSVEWAITDLLNTNGDRFEDRPKIPDPITQARIDYLFEHGLYDLPDSQRPDCHRDKKHSYGSVYGRMKWDEPAPTITGGYDTMGRGRFVHPRRRRTITTHEAARLQFIPDFFDFSGLESFRSTLAESIGNAVPPKLSYVLALELLR